AQSGTLPNGFTYVTPAPAPSVTAITPVSGPAAGGTHVTITGANFVGGATVSIGAVPAASVTVVNATTITATTGPHAPALVNVVVTNPDGQSVTLPSAFSYAFIPPSGAPSCPELVL